MNQFCDNTFDVVVAGTGVAALSAAVTAADAGLKVLMLESTDRWGGSSAMSAGGLWLPNNPLMRRDGVGDSREEAFVDGVDGFITLAERLGVKFARAADYPDYYPERPGGKIGRALEVEPFDVKRIGTWWETSRGQDGVPASVKTDDFWLLSRAWSTPSGFTRGARVVFRVLGSLARGRNAVGMGAAVTASLLEVALRLGVTVWLSSPITEVLFADGRVAGVRTTHADEPVTVKAERGVVLGGGGFDHNTEWREKYQGVDGAASSGSRGNAGSAIDVGQRAGGALDLMDDAWWGGSIPGGDGEGLRDVPCLYAAGNNSASVMGRTYPGPGSTLGPAAVFGYLAARHLAEKE